MDSPTPSADVWEALPLALKWVVGAAMGIGTLFGSFALWVFGKNFKPSPVLDESTASRVDVRELEARVIAAERENARFQMIKDMQDFCEGIVKAESDTRRTIYSFMDQHRTAMHDMDKSLSTIAERLAVIISAIEQVKQQRRL